MASINFNLPSDIAWGDYLLDGRSVKFTVEVTKPSEEKTEVVHIQKEPAAPEPRKWSRPMPWCKRGNSCPWSNCKFRHERCKHHDRWVVSGSVDNRGCRSLKYDPLSNKCPTDGGCMYDHRSPSDLKMFIELVEINSHEDLMDNFKDLGLVHMSDESYHIENMKKEDKQLFIRSLKDARDNEILQYGEELDGFMIHFIND